LFIVFIDSIGYFPLAVSPLSITASAPSNIAFATSDASALVGLGFSVIDSSICVATITGFPAALHFFIIIFCTVGTSSGGMFSPRSPLATIAPSDNSSILSKFVIASGCSIFAIINTFLFPHSFLIFVIASGFLTSDAAIMSRSIFIPYAMSFISCVVTSGKLTETPGMSMDFCDFIVPSFMTLHITWSPLLLNTLNSSFPSSANIVFPLLTSFASPL